MQPSDYNPFLPAPAEQDPKPWYSSTTIWSGVASILSGVGALVLVVLGQAGQETIAPAMASILAGIGAIRGRLQADRPIGPLG
jgi:hypothetical protein